MIIIRDSRQNVEAIKNYFFPYINMLKATRMKDALNNKGVTDEYLNVLLVNQLLDDIEQTIIKKLINTEGHKVKVKLSNAEGIIFYKSLLKMPVAEEHVHLNMLRNQWIEIMNQQILFV